MRLLPEMPGVRTGWSPSPDSHSWPPACPTASYKLGVNDVVVLRRRRQAARYRRARGQHPLTMAQALRNLDGLHGEGAADRVAASLTANPARLIGLGPRQRAAWSRGQGRRSGRCWTGDVPCAPHYRGGRSVYEA
ncbi:MAG: hypothetical protein ACLRWQ_17870 [Flavonifractor plautii]